MPVRPLFAGEPVLKSPFPLGFTTIAEHGSRFGDSQVVVTLHAGLGQLPLKLLQWGPVLLSLQDAQCQLGLLTAGW